MRGIATAVVLFGCVFYGCIFGGATVALACTGDGDGDGQVGVWEVIALVDCALAPTPACGSVHVDDVVAAVRHALHGCDLAPRWLTAVPCVQCEPCAGSINGLIALANGTPADLGVPADVLLLDHRVDGPAVCLACGCPLITVHALVPGRDVARMRAEGWEE